MKIKDNMEFSFDPMADKLHEECGVFGITGTSDASAHCALGLHALQHRGQEGAGIVSYDEGQFHQRKAFGKVGDNFGSQKVIDSLPGKSAIGHNRYSTSGGKKNIRNVQPIFADFNFGGLALAHNGNLTNSNRLRHELIGKGSIFHSTMDTEVVMHLIALSSQPTILDRLIEAIKAIEGAYSMILLTKDHMIGLRDPYGVRPLVLGKLDDVYVLASETCALDIIGAEYQRDVEPGEIISISHDGTKIESYHPFRKRDSRFCIFEYVYFSRPDSHVDNRHVYQTRVAMGRELARTHHVEADVIVPVPDSGVPAALGYSDESGIEFALGIIRNHYVGRTFIEPTDSIRHLGVKLKHNANRKVLEGKRVILVDDSIVRGTTSRKIVDMVRAAGAAEVHMRISSPPTTDSCFYGVDTPSKDKLIASKMSIDEIADFINADSLGFLDVESLYRAVGEDSRNAETPQFCDSCFTGEYPIPIKDDEVVATLLHEAN